MYDLENSDNERSETMTNEEIIVELTEKWGRQFRVSKTSLRTYFLFLRPHTVRGTVTACLSLIFTCYVYNEPIIKNVGWISLYYAAIGIISLLCANGFIVGINQIYDISIDEINKPYLPLAARLMTLQKAWRFILTLLIIGLTLVFVVFPIDVFGLYCLGLVVGGVYSIPQIRLKRYPIIAALSITLCRGFLLNYGILLSAPALLDGPVLWPIKTYVLIPFLVVYTFVIAVMKDLPDVDGDRQADVTTFSLVYGVPEVTKIASSLLVLNYLVMSSLGLLRRDWFFRPNFHFFYHVIALILFLRKFRATKKSNYTQLRIRNLYAFIWKLLYWEYIAFLFT